MNQYSEYRSTYMNTPAMSEMLLHGSVSVADAKNRANEYAKMFSRNDEMMEGVYNSQPSLLDKAFPGYYSQKTFSGYSETPLLSTQYFNASC